MYTSTRSGPRYFLGIFLLVLTTLDPTAIPVNGQKAMSPLQGADCWANSGWIWTNGPSQPEIAVQAQQALNEAGIEATVEATSYGETDNCGTFRLFAVDFTLTMAGIHQLSEADQQQLTDDVYPLLARFGKPNIGIAKVILATGKAVVLDNRTITAQLPTATSNADWQQVITTIAPQGRYIYGLAYDSHRKVTILFGGDNTGSARLNDTWEYDGTNWRQITPPQSPTGRANIDQTLVYDSNRRKVVLFGGLGVSSYLNDTWEYNGITWLRVNTIPTPGSRDSHAMVFDDHRNVTVLFGGYGNTGSRLNDTWEYNGAWQQVNTAQAPSGRLHHAMAFDNRRGVIVLFGGIDSSNARLGDTWEYDGTNWKQVTPTQSPPPHDNHTMTYDSDRGVIVLFGGIGNNGRVSDTWEYDGTTWRQVTTPHSPSPRTEMSLIYDSQRRKSVFFGGAYWSGGSLTTFKETWEYSASISPSPGVLIKKVYVIAYNPILSNGQKLSAYLNWNDHAAITQQTVDFFKQASNNRMWYEVVDTTIVTDGWPELVDGFRYTELTYLAVINGAPPPSTAGVDYTKIANSPRFDICGKANRGEIDEVWIYNGPAFGFFESTLVGPGAYWYNSPPVPGPTSCNRLVPIMGPSPERSVSEAVENFGHRTESTMSQVYGSWQENRTAHNWDRYALVKALSPDYSYSGCGNIHFPPNGTRDYEYNNPSTVMSNCNDFANYPNLSDPLAVAQPVACSVWNCKNPDYFHYWFGHFPYSSGCGPDNVANNWWKYFANPAQAINPPSACRTSLNINFSTGRPGSFFTLISTDYPPNSPATISINGRLLSTTTIDSSGNLAFTLNTSNADTGKYRATITANLSTSSNTSEYLAAASVDSSASVEFTLGPGEPLRPQMDIGTIITVPSGIAFTHSIFSPVVQK